MPRCGVVTLHRVAALRVAMLDDGAFEALLQRPGSADLAALDEAAGP